MYPPEKWVVHLPASTSSSNTLTSVEFDIDIGIEIDIDPLLIFTQSGSQGNLCDSWAEDERQSDGASSGGSLGGVFPRHSGSGSSRLSTSKIRAMPAEYPFQANLGLPQSSVNFDLTHKRGRWSLIILFTLALLLSML